MYLQGVLIALSFCSILQCGRGSLIKRDIARPGQFPYAVGIHILMDDSRHAGALVSEAAVLTAAIPLYVDPKRVHHNASLYLGAFRWGSLHEHGREAFTVRIGDFIVHPEYNPRYATDALAFIKLPNGGAHPSPTIQPIALPSHFEKDKSFDDYPVQVPIWGRYYMNNKYPKVMNFVNSSVLPYNVCQKQKKVYRGRFCLRGVFGSSLCSGDEGAPVAVISNNRPLLIGVVAKVTCKPNDPTLVTRLTRYLDWIELTLDVINHETLEEKKRLNDLGGITVTESSTTDEAYWKYYTSSSTVEQTEETTKEAERDEC